MTLLYLIPRSALGGRSPKTGLRVGQRHRWNGGAWGLGRCAFCGRSLEEVRQRKNVTPGGGKSPTERA